jgi:hypothetical protein
MGNRETKNEEAKKISENRADRGTAQLPQGRSTPETLPWGVNDPFYSPTKKDGSRSSFVEVATWNWLR